MEIRKNQLFFDFFDELDKNVDKVQIIENNKVRLNRVIDSYLFNALDGCSIFNDLYKRSLYVILNDFTGVLTGSYLNRLFNKMHALESSFFSKNAGNINPKELSEYIIWKNNLKKNDFSVINKNLTSSFFSNDFILDYKDINSLINYFSNLNIADMEIIKDFIQNRYEIENLMNRNFRNYSQEERELFNSYVIYILKYDIILANYNIYSDKIFKKILDMEIDSYTVISNIIPIMSKSEIINSIEKFNMCLSKNGNYNWLSSYYMLVYLKNKCSPSEVVNFYLNNIYSENKYLVNKKFPWVKNKQINDFFNECIEKFKNGFIIDIDRETELKYIKANLNKKTFFQPVFINFYRKTCISSILTDPNSDKSILKYYDADIQDFIDLSFEQQVINAKNWFMQGKVIPYSVAKGLLKANLDGLVLDEFCTKAIIESVANNYLKSNNIKLNHIFFFDEVNKNGKSRYGSCSRFRKNLFINNHLIRAFLSETNKIYDLADIFMVLFHELKHIIQFESMRNLNLDFNTYNIMKEDCISDCDRDFYENNYNSLIGELNANFFSYEETLNFFSQIDSEYTEKIRGYIYEKYEKKLKYIENMHIKKIKIGQDNLNIDINVFLDLLFKSNPGLLLKNYPYLEIEFNISGKRKSIVESFYYVDKNYFENLDFPLALLKVLFRQSKNEEDIKKLFSCKFKKEELNELLKELCNSDLKKMDSSYLLQFESIYDKRGAQYVKKFK